MSFAGWMHRRFGVHIRPLRGGLRDIGGRIVRPLAKLQWTRREAPKPHGLPAPLIVSLTSYPPRFRTLKLTLRCLLSQSLRPDAVILWLAKEDVGALPRDVLDLRRHGLTIAPAPDWGPYKKIAPALLHAPEAHIVTADDDVFYWSTWLEDLLSVPTRRDTVCLRAHTVVLGPDGLPMPYLRWRFDTPAGPPSPLTFATGVGGVHYPPASLHADAAEAQHFLRLCPGQDDLWLFWMSRLAGVNTHKIGPRRAFVPWPRSQQVGLHHAHLAPDAPTDSYVAALVARYGWPVPAEAPPFPANA